MGLVQQSSVTPNTLHMQPSECVTPAVSETICFGSLPSNPYMGSALITASATSTTTTTTPDVVQMVLYADAGFFGLYI